MTSNIKYGEANLKTVDQQILDQTHGDCFSACIASLLELPSEEVPNFMNKETRSVWFHAANLWLHSRGYHYIEVDYNLSESCWYSTAPGAWCILIGDSPRDPGKHHAVVGQITNDGINMIHDPYPDKTFLSGPPKLIGFIVPLDPMDCKRKKK
jgi:hypothetical protein